MRKFKRLASLALAAVMTLGMCAPAFATGGEEEQAPPATYDVYQIFTGQYLEKQGEGRVLSNIKWGQNGRGGVGTDVTSEILEELNNAKYKKTETGEIEKDADDNPVLADNQTMLSAITKYVNLESKAFKSEVPLDSNGKLTINVGEGQQGYYLVKTHLDENGKLPNGQAATTYVVKVIDTTLTVAPKTGVPTVDKKIIDDAPNSTTQGSSTSAAAIGSVLTFELTGTMPDNIDDYKSYYYTFTDTMSTGLTYVDDSAVVKLDGEDIRDQVYVGFENQVLTIGTKNLKDIATNLTKDSIVTVTYKAKLTEEANTGATANENNVYLTYSNDPNKTPDGIKNDPNTPPTPDPNDPTSETVKGTPNGGTKTYITGLTVTVLADDKPVTADAEFKLTGEGLNVVLKYEKVFEEADDGTWYKLTDGTYTETEPTTDTSDQYESSDQKYKQKNEIVKIGNDDQTKEWEVKTLDNNGKFSIAGLNAGTYTLSQTKSPNGYNLMDDIHFTIEFNETDKFYCNDNEMVTEQEEWFYITINQKLGALLPETGGVGTTMMYIGGMLLIAMAGATIILKGKKAEDSAE